MGLLTSGGRVVTDPPAGHRGRSRDGNPRPVTDWASWTRRRRVGRRSGHVLDLRRRRTDRPFLPLELRRRGPCAVGVVSRTGTPTWPAPPTSVSSFSRVRPVAACEAAAVEGPGTCPRAGSEDLWRGGSWTPWVQSRAKHRRPKI